MVGKYTMKNTNLLKFPCVLRKKIENGEFVFPESTQYNYEPMVGFRGIERAGNDFTPVTRNDFLSYAELNVCRRGINRNDPHYYGVSLFINKSSVENALKFPKPNKKIAQGKVYEEAGPAEVNSETEHICWWLYDEIEIEGFSIC